MDMERTGDRAGTGLEQTLGDLLRTRRAATVLRRYFSPSIGGAGPGSCDWYGMSPGIG